MHTMYKFFDNYLLLMIIQINFMILINAISHLGAKTQRGLYHTNIDEYEIVLPEKINYWGDVLSYKIPHHYSRSQYTRGRNLRVDNRLYYRLPIEKKYYKLELWPNSDMLSPELVVESHGKRRPHHPHLMSHVQVKRSPDMQCHYNGRLRDVPNSLVAISSCDGLAGHIILENDHYLIEPVHKHNPVWGIMHPHLLYRYNDTDATSFTGKDSTKSFCSVSGVGLPKLYSTRTNQKKQMKMHTEKKSANGNPSNQTSHDHSTLRPMYLETLVVLDKTLIKFHKSLDLENYVLTVLNMAHNLFQDSSFGAHLNMVVVRIIRLETEDDEMNLQISPDASKVLDAFKAWANRINTEDDAHPHHHDVAILITRVDICADNTTRCGLLGLATLAAACEPSEAATIVEDCGLKLGYTIAHELAHLLGLPHDSPDESGCKPQPYNDGYSVVMAKSASLKTRGWSNCSREAFWKFVESGLAMCLYDEPSEHNFKYIEMLPGAMYGAAFQCKTLIDDKAETCHDVGIECNNLKCYVEGYGCVETHIPLAPGTGCGEHRWCAEGHCVPGGQRGGTAGGWGPWGPWTICSRSCGSGVARATRHCDNPAPGGDGKYCLGQRIRFQLCNVQACPESAISYRDLQCQEYNDWIYPEDNLTHQWVNYDITSDNPCKLYCMNEDKVVTLFRQQVVDGTPCYYGPRHICIAGQCKEIPCDMELNSNAIEDACGECHGNGATCNVESGEKQFFANTGCTRLLNIPLGVKHVTVEETSPTKAKLEVRNAKGTKTYIKGNVMGNMSINGATVWYGIVRHMQEMIRISSPVKEKLSIWVRTKDTVTVRYSIAKTALQHEPQLHWENLDWTLCSAQCGPGTQGSVPQCVENSTGVVEDKHCNALAKPGTLTRSCQERPCQPRWLVGTWKGCDCDCDPSAMNERSVACVKSFGEGEGETNIIRDHNCPAPKPIDLQKCNCAGPKRHVNGVRLNRRNNVDKPYNSAEQGMNKKRMKVYKKGDCVRQRRYQWKHNRPHLLKLKKGTLIIDKEDHSRFSLVLLMDKTNANQHLPGFPKPANGTLSVSVKGIAAIKALQNMHNRKI